MMPWAAMAILVSNLACTKLRQSYEYDECLTCHDIKTLKEPISDEAPQDWLQASSPGIARIDPWDPTVFTLGVTWPRRGHHGAESLSGCKRCHDRRSGNILKHGARFYPDDSLEILAQGGATCSSQGCHQWLGTIDTQGFVRADGTALSFSGSALPETLLSGADNAHDTVFREGYRQAEMARREIKVTALNPGCGGCHNAFSGDHGAMLSCTDCHAFGAGSTGASPHQRHINLIEGDRALNDPAHAELMSCLYCHGWSEQAGDLHRPACYNCHLSGHQPLDTDHRAHFWQ